MEEIKIYRSLLFNFAMIIGSIAFVLGGYYCIKYLSEDVVPFPIDLYLFDLYLNGVVFGWILIIFFGLCGVVATCMTFKQMLFKTPYMVIGSDGFTVDAVPPLNISFADIESFGGININGSKFILVYYKEGVKHERTTARRVVGNLNKVITGTTDGISVTGLKLSPEEVYYLLDERLMQYRASHP